MQPNNQANILAQTNTTISIQSLSPKQILGQCIDLSTSLFRQLVSHFLQNNNLENPFGQKVDFSVLCNYILDPSRIQNILQRTYFNSNILEYVKSNDKSVKQLVRSWLFQLKSMRNLWAHSGQITFRFAVRAFDTLALIYQAFQGDTQSQLFQKIQFYRINLVICQAKKYVS